MRDSSFPFLSLLVESSAFSAVDAEAVAAAVAVIAAAVIVAVAAAYFESPVAFVADVSIAILAASVVSPVVVVVGDVPLVLVVSSAALLGLDAALVTCCQALAVFLFDIAASVGASAVVDVAAVG